VVESSACLRGAFQQTQVPETSTRLTPSALSTFILVLRWWRAAVPSSVHIMWAEISARTPHGALGMFLDLGWLGPHADTAVYPKRSHGFFRRGRQPPCVAGSRLSSANVLQRDARALPARPPSLRQTAARLWKGEFFIYYLFLFYSVNQIKYNTIFTK